MRAANPDLSWRDVKLILAGSARRNDATSQGWATGALQYGSSGKRYSFHHDYGFGVVDAREAVGLADGWSGAPALRQTVPVLATVNHAIPDAGADGTGSRVESTATVGRGVGFVEFIEVDATFNADAFRDLDVRLTSPSGAVSILSVPYAQGDGTRYPLKGAFRFGSSRHLGEDPAGVWTLRVVDEVNGGGTNILESWSMKVYGHDPDEVAMVPGAPGIASGEVRRRQPCGVMARPGGHGVLRDHVVRSALPSERRWQQVGWRLDGATGGLGRGTATLRVDRADERERLRGSASGRELGRRRRLVDCGWRNADRRPWS